MSCIRLSISRNRKVLKVVKLDGKVVEFTSPVAVKELLQNFQGFGVKSSRKSSKFLPPSFELRLGKTYYLFPCRSSDPATNGVSTATAAVKRIKVVITRKQLEELLSKKTSVEKIIFGIDKACPSWKPSLVAIPEENELI